MEITYRKSEYTEEIISLLQKYLQNNMQLTLWQANARHEAGPGQVTNFEPKSRQLHLSVLEQREFDVNQPLYCYGKDKQLIFKSQLLTKAANSYQILISEDIRLEELRTNPRFELYSNKNAFMTLLVTSHYESKESSFVFKLYDISTEGCSLLVHSSNLKFIQVGDRVKVSQIGSDPIMFPIGARIKYIAPLQTQSKADVKLFRVGLAFEKKLTFAVYNLTKGLR